MKLITVLSCLLGLFLMPGAFSTANVRADEAGSEKKSDYEMLFWETVKDSQNIEMFRAYLKKYPNGNFADLAEIKIKALEKNAAAVPGSAPRPESASEYSTSTSGVHLRNASAHLEEKELQQMLQKYNFCDLKRNPGGDFKNKFIDNQNGTITDAATGLIWEKVGTWRKQNRLGADAYIQELNQKKFAGLSNWRLPTLEELASLIESQYTERDWLYIDPIFGDSGGDWIDSCWSADTLQPIWGADRAAWAVSFKRGSIVPALWVTTNIGIYDPQFEYNYVRAVSTLKQ